MGLSIDCGTPAYGHLRGAVSAAINLRDRKVYPTDVAKGWVALYECTGRFDGDAARTLTSTPLGSGGPVTNERFGVEDVPAQGVGYTEFIQYVADAYPGTFGYSTNIPASVFFVQLVFGDTFLTSRWPVYTDKQRELLDRFVDKCYGDGMFNLGASRVGFAYLVGLYIEAAEELGIDGIGDDGGSSILFVDRLYAMFVYIASRSKHWGERFTPAKVRSLAAFFGAPTLERPGCCAPAATDLEILAKLGSVFSAKQPDCWPWFNRFHFEVRPFSDGPLADARGNIERGLNAEGIDPSDGLSYGEKYLTRLNRTWRVRYEDVMPDNPERAAVASTAASLVTTRPSVFVAQANIGNRLADKYGDKVKHADRKWLSEVPEIATVELLHDIDDYSPNGGGYPDCASMAAEALFGAFYQATGDKRVLSQATSKWVKQFAAFCEARAFCAQYGYNLDTWDIVPKIEV